MGGKRQVFSDEENRALRAALRKYRDEHALTGTQVGELLNIKQQNAARLLGVAHTGMARDTANRLASLLGFRDAEDFLLAEGVLSEMKAPPHGVGWADRDIAVRIARRYGYDEGAIQAVVQRYTGLDYRAKTMRWWNDQIVLEQLARAADSAAVSPSTTPAPAGATVKARKRRGTGTDG